MSNEWRDLAEYERSILDKLLEVDFPQRAGVVLEARDCQVRSMDEDGCIEFRLGFESNGKQTVVAEGDGPVDADGTPVLIQLSVRGGHLLSLEFIRFDGRPDFRPPAADFKVSELSG